MVEVRDAEMLDIAGGFPLRLLSGDQSEETANSLKAYSLAFSQFHRVTDASEQLAKSITYTLNTIYNSINKHLNEVSQ